MAQPAVVAQPCLGTPPGLSGHRGWAGDPVYLGQLWGPPRLGPKPTQGRCWGRTKPAAPRHHVPPGPAITALPGEVARGRASPPSPQDGDSGAGDRNPPQPKGAGTEKGTLRGRSVPVPGTWSCRTPAPLPRHQLHRILTPQGGTGHPALPAPSLRPGNRGPHPAPMLGRAPWGVHRGCPLLPAPTIPPHAPPRCPAPVGDAAVSPPGARPPLPPAASRPRSPS